MGYLLCRPFHPAIAFIPFGSFLIMKGKAEASAVLY